MNNSGGIKYEIGGCVYYGISDSEKQIKRELEIKREMLAFHNLYDIVRCFDCETNLLLDECTLDDLFGN